LDEAAKLDGLQIFHAGTKQLNGEIVTAGGRVLAVTALGSTIAEARSRAYEAVARIHFENCHYRRDIALTAVTDNIQNLR
jgi:phosphoribosylamine--glycine ligase